MAEIFKAILVSDDTIHLKPSITANEPDLTVQTAAKPVEADMEKVNDITKQRCEEAFQSGFNQGLSEGIAKANTNMEEQITVLGNLLQSIPEAINANRLLLSNDIADIVLLIIQQFFINQQHSKEIISLQINQALAQLHDKQNIELALHPKDLTLLQQGKLKIDLKQCKNLRVVPDENLRLGGCIVRSKHGVFDAGIERQIDNLKQVLLQIKQGEARE